MRFRCGARGGIVSVLALLASASVFAQTNAAGSGSAVAPVSNNAESSQLARQYVNERLAVWQERLKLGGWQISAQAARASQFKPGTMGAIQWDKGKKTAVIFVLDPADYRLPLREMLDDMEMTVVHELIHLELASLPRSQASRSGEERAVNGIADALLQLDRAKR